MTAGDLFAVLAGAGVYVRAEGGRLVLAAGWQALPPAVLAAVRDQRDDLVRLLTAGCLVSGCEAVVIAWLPAAGEVGVCRDHGLFGHLVAEAAMAGRAEAAWPVARSGDEAAGRALLAALVAERANREAIVILAGRGVAG